MSPLIESLKLKDGSLVNLAYHQSRINRAMEELFPQAGMIDLSRELSTVPIVSPGVFKVRVVYGPAVEKIEIEPYTFRSVKSLKAVFHNSIDYHLKYSDRQLLHELYSQRESCDDIIIVKNGFVTDSFAANLVFFDGKTWFTPSSPLLKGTKRELLLNNGLIFEKEIKAGEIGNYQKVGLINAMIDFDQMPVIQIKDIHF